MSLKETIIHGDNRYSISSDGIVTNEKTGRKLKQNTLNKGYKQVTLYAKTGDRKALLVHRLVAKHFIDNPLNLPQVNHIDGNPSNNNVCNLEWCTAKENVQHTYDHLGRKSLKGSDHGMSKLDEAQVLIIRTLIKDLKISDIANYFKVSPSTILRIKNNRIWTH